MAVLLGIVCAFMAGKHYYDAHVSSFKDSARQKFVQILEQELVKREDMEQPIWSNRPRSVLSKNEMVKDTVKLILPKIGQRTYVIPLHRRLNNLEEVPEYRIMQSYILLHSPLRADTLLRLWQKSVSNSGHRLSVRVGVTDFLEKETFSYAGDTARLADADSLFSCYLGMRSEVEATGFAYGVWYRLLTVGQWTILFFLFAFTVGGMMCMFHFQVVGSWCRACRHHFFPLPVPSDDAAEADQEASSPLKVLGLTFYPDNLWLEGNKGRRRLSPQLALLFRSFVDAAGYQLSKGEIKELLWPDGNCNVHALHSAISRLRKELQECGEVDILDLSIAYKLGKLP